jgi:hypothetical protein
MISQQRVNELKRYNDPQKFFDAVLCEMSIVRQHREVFEMKVREFGNKCIEYKTARNKRINWKAVKEAVKDARRRKDIEVICTTPDKPPKSKWKRIDTQVKMDGSSFSWHFWVPPDFPDNPINWFNIYNTSHYHEMGRLFEEMYGFNNVSCLPEEMLLRDYVAIACLFNRGAEERGELPILPEILSGISIQREHEINISTYLWPKVKAVLIRTLETVNADLARLQKVETKQKELTREDILKIPPAPIGQRFCDFPEKDREFSELLLRFIKLRDGAARELTGEEKPDIWRRVLEVMHVTGLNLKESNSLTYADEIKILRAAAKMKHQQKVELQEGLKKAVADLVGTKQNGVKAKSPPEGEWSKPMSKSKMMAALGIDSYKTFNAWTKDKKIKPAGNRQTFTIRLDVLDTKTRQKLEKA